MFVRICDWSMDGGSYQVQCEDCGKPLDWISAKELQGIMALGVPVRCFECDGIQADYVPEQLLINGGLPETYLLTRYKQAGLLSGSIITEAVYPTYRDRPF